MTPIRLVLAITALAVTACTRDAMSTSSTDNSQIQLDKLFTHDGCTVYRFMDGGHFHYWADCRGSVSSNQSCGKNCIRQDEVTTL